MKRLFAINLSDKTDEPLTEEKFIVKTYESDNLFDTADAIDKKYKNDASKLRMPNIITAIVATAINWILIFALIFYMKSPAGENSPVIVTVAMLCVCLAAMIVSIYLKKKSEAIPDNEASRKLTEEKNKAIKELYASVGVPSSAETVDILHCTYEIGKNGQEKHVLCSTEPIWLFEENESIMISDMYALYAVPKSAFREIRYIEEQIITHVSSWHKPGSPISEEYGGRHTTVKNGFIFFSEYLSVRFTYENEEHEIRFPAYEASAISRILSLSPKR